MQLRMIIDGIPHEIDSTDPDLLARWVVEIFGRIREINPATLIEFQAFPSWVWSEGAANWAPDWLADSRVIAQIQRIRSPRDLVTALGAQIDELEKLNGR